MRTIVYIDGFNLYYRALHGTRFKWLDPLALSKNLLSAGNTIVALRYYTARVSGARDPDQPRKQQAYLSALGSIPNLTIYYGHFLPKTKRRPLVNPPPGGPRVVEIHDTEEKGSDVNLASHLIHDGWKQMYDVAVVVTKDTDLAEPIRLVVEELMKPVGIICPDGDLPIALRRVATFVRHVNSASLAASQFPDPIVKRDGKLLRKPSDW